MDKLNVAIADDNDLMRQLLDTIVQSDEELSVVGNSKRWGRSVSDDQGERAGCGTA